MSVAEASRHVATQFKIDKLAETKETEEQNEQEISRLENRIFYWYVATITGLGFGFVSQVKIILR